MAVPHDEAVIVHEGWNGVLGVDLPKCYYWKRERVRLTFKYSGCRCSPFWKSTAFSWSWIPRAFAVIRTDLTGGLGAIMYKVGAMVEFVLYYTY